MNNTIIIIGGGYSITDLIPLDLWDILQHLYTIGVNFSYVDIVPTALVCCDHNFYTGSVAPANSNWLAKLKELPLIIIPDREDLRLCQLPNTLMYQWTSRLCELSGLYATYIATKLQPSEIYLLGFDFCDFDGRTHYQTHTPHKGMGKISMGKFHELKPNELFSRISYGDIKVYNVSPKSRIDLFPKITPEVFIEKIKTLDKLDQDELRHEIKSILTEKGEIKWAI